MTTQDQICCPKCGSNQLSANKKGFSGKKAVAGAVLTGGIGLLAGTIGSNKIIITCLNCGHQFKPGDRPINNPDLSSEAGVSTKTTAIGCAVLIVLVALIFLIAKFGGYTDSKNASSVLKADTSKTVEKSYVVSSTPKPNIPNPNIKYQIISKEQDNRGYTNLMNVYTKNMANLKRLNAYLVSKYKNDNAGSFQIFYFDNKNIAKNYHNIVFDKSISDDEVDKLSQHIIGKYEYAPYSNIDTLEIGRDPDNL